MDNENSNETISCHVCGETHDEEETVLCDCDHHACHECRREGEDLTVCETCCEESEQDMEYSLFHFTESYFQNEEATAN